LVIKGLAQLGVVWVLGFMLGSRCRVIWPSTELFGVPALRNAIGRASVRALTELADGTNDMARSASAAMVREGFTPGFAETAERQ